MISTEIRTVLAIGSITLFIGMILLAIPVFAQTMDADTNVDDPKAAETGVADPGIAENSAEDGKALVELNCSGCHAVGARDASPHEEAPEFRKLLQRYPIDALEEAFDSGLISSGHPDMPDFVARPDQVDAILDYFLSIQER